MKCILKKKIPQCFNSTDTLTARRYFYEDKLG